LTTLSQPTFSLPRLRAELGGEVIGPQDAGYDEARAVHRRAIDRRPAAIVRPTDADGVAAIVSLARETGVELAVRSGAHSLAGHGVTDRGIVLDLSAMKTLQLDTDSRLAWVETGLTAGEVTRALGAHGFAIPFGDSASVGVGGLTLGGGIGFLVRKHGLTIDSLVAAEVVTADGELRYVDAEEEPDLFWAMRGGGGNFGVATSFCFRLHPLGAVTGGLLVLPATPATIASFVAAASEAPDEVSTIAAVLGGAPPLPFLPVEHHRRPVVMATVVFAGRDADAERALAPFRALGPLVDMVRPQPYPDLFGPGGPEGPPLAAVRTMFLDGLDEDAGAAILAHLRESTAQVAAVQLRVLGGAVARVASDATAYAHRSRPIMGGVAALDGAIENAPVHEAWARNVAGALRQGAPGAYVNFVGDEGAARVREAYPGWTWQRLAAIKREYDPENLFRLNQNIPPAPE
jgi:FAD/FMN-containing dehydrogenase